MSPRKKTPSEERKSLPDVIRRQFPLDSILLDKANPNRTNEDKEGILVASFASPESHHMAAQGKAREADVISLAANRGKPFKDEEQIRKAMDEAGSYGIYKELRELPGFDSYARDFQDKVEAFLSVGKMVWESDIESGPDNERKSLTEFMKLKELLMEEMVDYIPLLASINEKWKVGSEISMRHSKNCMFLALLDLVDRESKVAQKKNIIGLYGRDRNEFC